MSRPHDRPTTNPGGMECMECGVIFIGDETHYRCAVCEEEHEQAGRAQRERIADAEHNGGLSPLGQLLAAELDKP